MMISRRALPVTLLLGLVACEQESQQLPFDVTAVTTQTVSSSGGIVSTPAGAAVHFPNGSLNSAVAVTITQTTAPAPVQASGTVASTAFALEPAGTVLSKPAELEIRLAENADASRSWLASLVGVVNGVVDEDGASHVDLSTRIVSGDIERLGTYVAVIPPASAIFSVQRRISPALIPLDGARGSFVGVTADSITIKCGDPNNRCSGVSVTASQNLLDMVENAALIYPEITGTLRIGATQVTGSINAHATLRVLLESGRTAESIEINALLQPTAATSVTQTASDLRFTQVRHRVSGSATGESKAVEEVTTLVVPKSGANGTVTIQRTFDIRVSGGSLQPATVTITFPVRVHE